MVAPAILVVWRGDPDATATQSEIRFPAVADALQEQGFAVSHLAFVEEELERAREMMLTSSAVLVWVDPISGARNRFALDNLLRQVETTGVRIYTHPDTVLRMGTKDVLYDTRALSWSVDTESYRTFEEFQGRFPETLAEGARVLKQHRGNGGVGVWKVELSTNAASETSPRVRVQHAAPRDGSFEVILLEELLAKMEPFFEGSGHLINQQFVARVSEGMVRAYLVQNSVVGFARQYASVNSGESTDHVFGIPSAKTMSGADDPEFSRLRRQLEAEWVPGLQECLGLSLADLPLLWDADFLLGPKDHESRDSYKLCEINASCVSPFPSEAPRRLALALTEELVRT